MICKLYATCNIYSLKYMTAGRKGIERVKRILLKIYDWYHSFSLCSKNSYKKKKNNICKEHVLCKINVECIKI